MFLRFLFELNNKNLNNCLCGHSYSDSAQTSVTKNMISSVFWGGVFSGHSWTVVKPTNADAQNTQLARGRPRFIAFQIGTPVVSCAKVIAEGFSYDRSGFYIDSQSHFQLK